MGSNVKIINLKIQHSKKMCEGFLIPRLSKSMLHFDNDHGQFLIVDMYFPIICAF